jgi:hypothetical protein
MAKAKDMTYVFKVSVIVSAAEADLGFTKFMGQGTVYVTPIRGARGRDRRIAGPNIQIIGRPIPRRRDGEAPAKHAGVISPVVDDFALGSSRILAGVLTREDSEIVINDIAVSMGQNSWLLR